MAFDNREIFFDIFSRSAYFSQIFGNDVLHTRDLFALFLEVSQDIGFEIVT
jgi:hypothetical protein